MFSIGFFELCIIAVVALVFIGPKKLPELMQQAGRFFVQARRLSNEMRSAMDTVIQDAEKDIDQQEYEKARNKSLREPIEQTLDTPPRTATQASSHSELTQDETAPSELDTGMRQFPRG